VIPCLDIHEGRVVKGIQFVDLADVGDPVESARHYDAEGADELVFLDISATSEGRDTVLELAGRVARAINIPFTVGGGIKSVEDIKKILDAGANKVSIGSAAIFNPELIREAAGQFGRERILVAIDAKKEENGDWRVYVHGGKKPTGFFVRDWAKQAEECGCGEILLTSMDRDGTKDGYDIELLSAVTENVTIPVVASGGAGRVEDFAPAILDGGADAVLAASLFHFREVSIAGVKEHLVSKGIPVRRP
jgi:cyclase